MAENAHTGKPIFILGIMPRSGTNFLKDLLMLHPHCVRPSEPIWETYLVHHSDTLREYIDLVFGRWHHGWGVPPKERDSLREHISGGILRYLATLHEPGTRLILKTPSVRCLSNHRVFFPDCPLLVLVRDGRSVVESGVRTFDWDYEWAIRSWRDAAETVLRFDEDHRETGGYRILRYEDLYRDPHGEMTRVLEFLGLPREEYYMASAEELPIRGSSQVRGDDDRVHWTPVERPADFTPTERWRDWPARLYSRFDWLAGGEARALGYRPEQPKARIPAAGARNRILDVRWRLATLRSFAMRNGRALGRRIMKTRLLP